MADKEFKKFDFGTKCVCVGRVSTSGQSQTAQINDLNEFAKNLGFNIIQPFFTTESGFLEYDQKQGWNLVTDFFEQHKDYKVLICPELSRLSRKERILHKIKDYLIENHIQLIIKDVNYFLFNEFGEIPQGNDLIFSLYASLADSEMRQKKERFSRSLKDYRQQGYCLGGKQLFGYERYYEPKNGKNRSRYRINEKEAEEIRTIYRWYAFGLDGDVRKTTVLRITQRCIEEGFSHYLHSKRNVNKCLKEQAYFGSKETHNRVKNPDYWNYHKQDAPKYIPGQSYLCTYPPIFTGDDVALRDLVDNRLLLNNSRLTRSKDLVIDKSSRHTTLLSKLLVCPMCGCFLHADYRVYPGRTPQSPPRKTASYRCNNSHSVIKVCGFKHSNSLPLLDSVIWAYCKNNIEVLMKQEQRNDVKSQISEIQKKIDNITKVISEYDVDSRIKTEDAILRAKTRNLKSQEALDDAVADYNAHIKSIEKEMKGYAQRKQELEQELKEITESATTINAIKRSGEISMNKQSLYRYIHKVINKIEFLSWNKKRTIIKVYNNRISLFHRPFDYIFVYSLPMATIKAYVVSAHGILLNDVTFPAYYTDNQERIRMRQMLNIPSTKDFFWDPEKQSFVLGGLSLSAEDIENYSNLLFHKIEKTVLSTMKMKGLAVIDLDVERLTCYQDD